MYTNFSEKECKDYIRLQRTTRAGQLIYDHYAHTLADQNSETRIIPNEKNITRDGLVWCVKNGEPDIQTQSESRSSIKNIIIIKVVVYVYTSAWG